MRFLEIGYKRVDNVPKGWHHNPSERSQRVVVVILSTVGTCIGLYLSLFQLNVISTVVELFFNNDADVIQQWRDFKILSVAPALISLIIFVLNAVFALAGSIQRWRTKPWIVFAFGFTILVLGAVNVGISLYVTTALNVWHSFNFLIAILSTVMIGPSLDEILASAQYIKQQINLSRPFWPVFLGRRKN